MTNPLFPTGTDDNSYLIDGKPKSIAPLDPAQQAQTNAAADMIRQKLDRLYAGEPNAKKEIAEANAAGATRSKHQEFMYRLSTSGRSLAEIQTAWHQYYVELPDNEKHEVWQEFYASAQQTPYQQYVEKQRPAPVVETRVTVVEPEPLPERPAEKRTIADIKKQILHHVTAGGKLQRKHHLQSLLFGAATGLVVVVIFLFGFFNEVIISPFIQPSRKASATPVIVDPNSVAVSGTPEVIIPKINVEIPVDYSQTTTDENAIEGALNSGIVHYPTTSVPGQKGNAAFFGHSSNNIFNPGKYKFAFVLLHDLVPGDTFYLTKDGKPYIYKVFSRTVVDPSEIGVLNPVEGHTATATLITCDPPGTSLKRLVVVGDQISPDPAANTAAPAAGSTPSTTPSTNLPGNGPTLWSRLWHSIF